MAKRGLTEQQQKFDELIREFGFKRPSHLLKSIWDKYGKKSISKAEFYKIRDKKVNPNNEFRGYIANRLSISVSELERRLKLEVDTPNSLSMESSFLRSQLIPYLTSKLDAASYQDRHLVISKTTVSTKDRCEFENTDREYSIQEILEKGQEWIIVGESGVGKTILLHQVALLEARKGFVPIYIDLRKPLQRGVQHLKKRIIYHARLYSNISSDDSEYIGINLSEDQFAENSFIFLFDHLDQARPLDENRIPEVISSINSFIDGRTNNNDRYVVCCRTNFDKYYSSLPGSFGVANLERFEDTEAVERILAALGIEYLHEDSRVNARLLDFGRNPQHLKMLIYIKEERGDLRITREVEIFEQFVRLHIEVASQRPTIGESLDLIKPVLGHWAFCLFDSESTSVKSKTEITEYLRRAIPDLIKASASNVTISRSETQKVIDEVFAIGLIDQGREQKEFNFIHDSLRDYFCAYHLVTNEQFGRVFIDKKLKDRENIISPEWEDIIIYYAGLLDDPTSLIQTMIDEEFDDIFFSNFRLAAKCAAMAKPAIDKSVCEQIVNKILNYVDKHDLEIGNLFNDILWTLKSIKHDAVIDKIVSEYKDTGEGYPAIEYLERIGSDRAVEVLSDMIDCDEDLTHSYVTYALANIGSQAAGHVLIKELNERRLNHRIILVLGSFEMPETVDALAQLLKGESPSIVCAATASLGRLKAEKAIQPLIELMQDNRLAIDPLSDGTDLQTVGMGAVRALGKIGSSDAVEPLIELLQYDEDSPFLIDEAIIALGKIGSSAKAAVKRLIELIVDEDLTYLIVVTLGKIGAEEAVVPLAKLLDSEDEQIALKASEALSWIKTVESAQIQVDHLSHAQLGHMTGLYLQGFGFDMVGQQVLDKLLDENAATRINAIHALGRLHHPDAVEPLLNYINHDDPDIRYETIRALGEISDERAVPELIKRLADEDKEIVLCTIKNLGEFTTREAIDALIDIIDDGNGNTTPSMCIAAIEALKDPKPITAVPPLIKKLYDPNIEVQIKAIEALGGIGIKSEEAATALLDKLGDATPKTDYLIMEALTKIGLHIAIDKLCDLSAPKSMLYELSVKTGRKITSQMYKEKSILIPPHVFCCTEKLLKEFKTEPLQEIPAQVTSFHVWYANLLSINRRKCVLFTHSQTLYSFVVFGLKQADFKNISTVFAENLNENLKRESIVSPYVNGLVENPPELLISKTKNRSILGSMNDHVYHIKAAIEDQGGIPNCDVVGLSYDLNRVPMGALNHGVAIDFFKHSLQSFYPSP